VDIAAWAGNFSAPAKETDGPGEGGLGQGVGLRLALN
jgi:hypothetical protein